MKLNRATVSRAVAKSNICFILYTFISVTKETCNRNKTDAKAKVGEPIAKIKKTVARSSKTNMLKISNTDAKIKVNETVAKI